MTDLVSRSAELAPTSANAEQRTVEVVWSTGAAVRRPPTRTEPAHVEELVLDPAACRLDVLNSGAPLLANHRRDGLDAVLGSVVPGSVRIEDGRGVATVRFSRRADVDPIWQDVLDGHLRTCSVAYRRDRIERLPPAAPGEPERWRVVDWTPLEISLVTIPADLGARIRSSFDGSEENAVMTADLPPNEQQRADPPPPQAQPAPQPDTAEVVRAAVEAERARVAEITALAQRFSLGQEFTTGLISSGASVDQARQAALEALAQRSAQTAVYPTVTTRGGLDETVTRRQALEEAIAWRMSPGDQPSELARQYVGFSAVELAREVLSWSGVQTRGMTRSEIVQRAMQTTSDFPKILGDVANKRIAEAYRATPRLFTLFSRERTATDFRAMHTVGATVPPLKKVLEGAEYEYGAIVERGETYAIATYGRVISITRQLIINDNLGAIQAATQDLGRVFANLENRVFWDLFLSNPVLSDGHALFSSAHKNLASPGSALSATSFDDGWAAIASQLDEHGEPIAATPAYLLVPTTLQGTALRLVDELQPTDPSQTLPREYRQAITVLAEPRLRAASTTAWYLLCSASTLPAFEYAYLEGERGPQTFQETGFMVDGVNIKARIDFGAGVANYRGAYRNPGA